MLMTAGVDDVVWVEMMGGSSGILVEVGDG